MPLTHSEKLIKELDDIFNPASIAIVGLPKGMKAGKLFLIALLDQKYPGVIYPVHPDAKEIDGFPAYPTVSDIPGPVDLAIILVSQEHTLDAVRECAAKGVKGAVLFTAGYKETGTDEGRHREEELVRVARSSGMRLIGPNCMGLYSPRSGLAFFPDVPTRQGPIGLISHSGSLANIICHMAPEKGLYFSKAVSLGNECDLTATDFLRYLGKDSDTKVIGTYLEGIKNAPAFLEALRETSPVKPVILWKVGLTKEGSRAAASHTGALALSRTIWENALRQGGGVPVSGFEAWMDALIGFSMLPDGLGDRMAIISGPGGLAVSAAEACGTMGLRLADLSPETAKKLARFVPPTGTSLRNPIDVGLTASLQMDIYIESARVAAADPGVDAVAVSGIGFDAETNRIYSEAMIDIRNRSGKAFLIINIPGLDPDTPRRFFDAGVPFFDSAERAMRTYAQVLQYQRWRQAHSSR
ncbi:MAG: CoA-binding protein [Deltaproteobacteria bacterium]|nr:CoA-binding protein [Deltaproteobacteria bacterium]